MIGIEKNTINFFPFYILKPKLKPNPLKCTPLTGIWGFVVKTLKNWYFILILHIMQKN